MLITISNAILAYYYIPYTIEQDYDQLVDQILDQFNDYYNSNYSINEVNTENFDTGCIQCATPKLLKKVLHIGDIVVHFEKHGPIFSE